MLEGVAKDFGGKDAVKAAKVGDKIMEKGILDKSPTFLLFIRKIDLSCCPGRVLFPEKESHKKPGYNGKEYGPDSPGEAQLPSENPGCQHDGQDIDGRTGV